jgi:hypothetical protein
VTGTSSPAPTARATGSAPGSAKATACQGVTTINQALTSLAALTVNATVGEVKAAQAKVATAVRTIEAQHPADPQGLASQVSAANANLTEKLAGYPDQTPIGQTTDTVQDLKAKAAEAQGKTAQLAATLQCPPHPS